MLYGALTHPEILKALASAGHGAQIVIADGNYPFSTGANPAAPVVYLNFAPGLLKATEVLGVLAQAIPIEAAQAMVPDEGTPPIFADFQALLPPGITLSRLKRFEFYEAARSVNTALVIATGEQRIYADVLLTIGVIPPEDT